MTRLWVIEMLFGQKNGEPVWAPTVGVGCTREQARHFIDEWRESNPADKFRIREYRPYDIVVPLERDRNG